jgi:hypothetical protein
MKFQILLTVAVLVAFCGCTSPNVAERPLLEIISDPAGAKIEINNDYVGETPWRGWFQRGGGSFGVYDVVTITAFPISPGQYTQTKVIGPLQAMPRRIYFNMNLGPSEETLNLNIESR